MAGHLRAVAVTALVIGANGFLGSHVTRALVAAGQDVRVMVRPGAVTTGIDDLPVTRHLGDVFSDDVLREAMTGAEVVYYCAVDTRGWLRDPAPLFRTNVEGTRNVCEIATEPEIAAGIQKFVYTSSYVTVGRRRGRVATEADVIGNRRLTPYVRSRVQGENLVLDYAQRRALPAVAMCVSTTYGARDWGRTPHGAIVAGAALGKLPFVMGGIELEAVGVEDAAQAMLLAAEHGRVGHRYLVSDKMIANTEVVRIAAAAAGAPPPSRTIPLPVSWAMAALGSLRGRLRGTDERLSLESLRLMRAEAPVDCTKARTELGWQPAPVEDAIRAAARFWVEVSAARRRSPR